MGLYLGVVAIGGAVYFTVFPPYEYDAAGNTIVAAATTWRVIEWLRAVGFVLILVTAVRERHENGDEATARPRRSPGSNVLLCGTVLLALVFVTNWFGAVWGEYPDLTGSTVWPYIEIRGCADRRTVTAPVNGPTRLPDRRTPGHRCVPIIGRTRCFSRRAPIRAPSYAVGRLLGACGPPLARCRRARISGPQRVGS